jgi:hypothetical protein
MIASLPGTLSGLLALGIEHIVRFLGVSHLPKNAGKVDVGLRAVPVSGALCEPVDVPARPTGCHVDRLLTSQPTEVFILEALEVDHGGPSIACVLKNPDPRVAQNEARSGVPLRN